MSSTTVFIRTGGVWLGVSDESCAVNTPEFWRRALPSAVLLSEVRALEDRGELLSWTTVLDGGYRIAVVENNAADFRATSAADVDQLGVLNLPSGRLVIRSALVDVEPIRSVTLEPGVYRARLEWFVDEESKHYDVQSEGEYPENDGPDGIITLARIGQGPDPALRG